LRYLGGLWQVMPKLGAVGMFFALAAMGLPALASFVGEVLVLAGTFQASVPFAAVASGGLILSVIYALWLVQKVFQGPLPSMEETDVVARDLDAREWLMLAPAILITLWLGLCPMIALDTSAPAIRKMIEPPSSPAATVVAPAIVDLKAPGQPMRAKQQADVKVSSLFGVDGTIEAKTRDVQTHSTGGAP
jgi:NADH:ubiquinone oxidoreductase subunit 4 (subunit M)